jgi:mannose/fructose/N-acetylgalactosamine-specific phosphotransferase system component IIB
MTINGIVIADDEVTKDSLQMTTLKMACPSEIKLAIKSVSDAIGIINNPKSETMRILVLVKNPANALKILNETKGITWVNIGNYGRMNKDEGNKKPFTKEVFASDDDLNVFQQIADTGIKFQIQMVPADTAKSVSTILGSRITD